MKPNLDILLPSFHVAMSAETYQALRRAYEREQRPIVKSIWDGLLISIDHTCGFGVVEHRKGLPQ